MRRRNSNRSNWLITLVSTMLGVVAGFYLSNYGAERALHKAQQKALEAVKQELNENQGLLQEYQEIMLTKFTATRLVFGSINKDFELVVPKDSMDSFIQKTQSIFTYQSHKDTLQGQVKLQGDVNVDINNKLVVSNLSSVVWSSYKQTEFLSITPFGCISDIETIHDMQTRFNQRNNTWKSSFFEGRFMGDTQARAEFLQQWQSLVFELELLLKMLNLSEKAIGECG